MDTQVCSGRNLYRLYDAEGVLIQERARDYLKYIPFLKEMERWVCETGFEILEEWSDHGRSPISQPTNRVIFLARKPQAG